MFTILGCFQFLGSSNVLVRKKRLAIFKNILSRFTGKRKRQTDSSYNPLSAPSYTSPKPPYTTPPSPPPQMYGVRVRQRRDFSCNDPKYIRYCANLEAKGIVVKCGERRFRYAPSLHISNFNDYYI